MVDLRQRRKELGLTMKQVADAVGVSEATISRYESGNIKNMRRDRLDKYARILQVEILDIVKVNEGETQMNERRGKHFKLFSMMVNGVKYYFIGSINTLGYKWVYSNAEDAVEMFENVERNAEKYGVTE